MPLNLERVRAKLPGRTVIWFESIPSTMPEAARLASEGASAGTVVVAEEQTAGQGRLGRSWYSEKESGLYVSFVLRPAAPEGALQLVTVAAGLAAQEAVERVSGVRCRIKWPNDLLADGKKCGGILCQTAEEAVIAGIGINVNHAAFPPELAGTATSLRMLTGRITAREELLVELAERIDHYCGILEGDGGEAVLRLFAERAGK
ncbi:MAG: biotin--[acetyl-CoA-carboxylase] ligase [Bryobacteraceae bacterium]|nr:biotin--[acetyl-CoA-carboxylase] ligase [Bryobacteraceae bacterium]